MLLCRLCMIGYVDNGPTFSPTSAPYTYTVLTNVSISTEIIFLLDLLLLLPRSTHLVTTLSPFTEATM